MSNRISTAGMHNASVSAMLELQSQMAATQNQLTTGKKFQTAAEDPIGAVRSAGLDRTLADNAQYGRNSDIVQSRLQYEEQSLADATSVLQSVRDLAVQGANSTLGAGERKALAANVRQQIAGLLDIANRADSNGEYLFAGTSTGTRPFAPAAGGAVSYQGDLTTRQIRISSTQSLADGHTGADVFMNLRAANGTFSTAVAGGNTGNATIDVGTLTDPTQWVAANYTIQFTSPTDWQVLDSATPTPNVVASGSGFTSGQSISFLGATVAITGTPATNDSFTVQPAQKTDVFAMLDQLADALEGNGSGAQDDASFKNQVGKAIANLDVSLDHVVGVRSEVGSRLSAIDQATNAREDEAVDLKALQSNLRDVDYAATISKLNQQYLGLQAAQQVYSNTSQLSLFNYIK